MFSLIEMLGRSCPAVDVVDIGAMMDSGSKGPVYRGLMRDQVARVVGFEPVDAECAKLNAMGLKGHRYLPYFVGDGTERTFYLTNDSMTSSLYKPNENLVKRFNNLLELMTTVSTSKVQTRRLDDIPEITGVDYIKCDVQGAELDVLKGAMGHLPNVTVVDVEVEFVPLYEGQPLFADVDTFMRSQGFLLHTLQGPMGRAFKPVVVYNDINRHLRQALWADAVYVRDFTRLHELTAEQLLKMAVILHEVYMSADLVQVCLYQYDLKTKAGLWPVYTKRLSGREPEMTPVV